MLNAVNWSGDEGGGVDSIDDGFIKGSITKSIATGVESNVDQAENQIGHADPDARANRALSLGEVRSKQGKNQDDDPYDAEPGSHSPGACQVPGSNDEHDIK